MIATHTPGGGGRSGAALAPAFCERFALVINRPLVENSSGRPEVARLAGIWNRLRELVAFARDLQKLSAGDVIKLLPEAFSSLEKSM